MITPTLPPPEDLPLITEASRAFAPLEHRPMHIQIKESGVTLELPASVVDMLSTLLTDMSMGRAVTVGSHAPEVTTEEAAHILNVSRPFVIKEVDVGRLPCRMVGTHRRIPLQPLLAYRKAMKEKSRKALDEMIRLGQELEGY